MRYAPMVALMLVAAAVSSAEVLPEDVQAKVGAYEAKCREIDAKAAADVSKERVALAKALKKAVEREKRAKHDDVAAAVQARLDEAGGDGDSAKGDSGIGPAGDLPWPEFIKKVLVISQGYFNKNGTTGGGIAQISVGGYTGRCGRGMNIVALVRGNPVIERAFEIPTHINETLPQEFDKLPDGAYVIMALQDELTPGEDSKINAIIRKCGGHHEFSPQFTRQGYILIGRKGAKGNEAIEIIAQLDEKIQYPPAAKP
ncbi:MAG: hypothetical protein H0V44_13420 [Planctomycetes bacterium]|nr:hypothetical protein [Planctomycetota bacterium]